MAGGVVGRNDYRQQRWRYASGMRRLLPLFASCVVIVAQDAPKIVSMTPANFAEVDAKTTTELVVVFDREMSKNGFSICGGGPKFPKVTKQPRWQGMKTLVVEVELVPNHDYEMSLNCPAAQNFRSKNGVVLEAVPWSFSTLPAKLPNQKQQGRRNTAAFKILMKTLEERYSYYDLRVANWPALVKQHEAAVLSAKTDRGFAGAVANMLRPTEDLHLYLQLGDRTFATGSRAIDSLFRYQLLGKYAMVKPVADNVVAGRTKDGIGYLLIATWAGVDTERIAGALTELADTKALVVDVRANAGGDELLAREVAQWFVDGTKVYAKHRVRTKAGEKGFGPVIKRTIKGNDASRSYDGPVALLTSRYVMSSNEAFVLMMKQGRDCVVVGQPTFGSSGNPQEFDLGNGVTIRVPCWQAMQPDETLFEGAGIQPDEFVPCLVDDLRTRDPILEKALALLRAKIAK